MSEPKTIKDRLVEEATRKAAEQAAKDAAAAVGKAADSALDAVETWLFGKVGGAEEAVKKDAMLDPLERLRAQYGEAPPPAAPPKLDPVEEARKQLEELKRQRNAPVEERKKTM